MESWSLPDLENRSNTVFEGASMENDINICWVRDHALEHAPACDSHTCVAFKWTNLEEKWWSGTSEEEIKDITCIELGAGMLDYSRVIRSLLSSLPASSARIFAATTGMLLCVDTNCNQVYSISDAWVWPAENGPARATTLAARKTDKLLCF